MKVGIRADREDFFYDMHSLVRSFFPDDDVSIYAESDTEKCMSPHQLEIRVTVPEYADRKAAKDTLKRDLYRMLSAYTGRELPWGILSGIRPTRIPMQMLDAGKSVEECIRYLRDEDYVSQEKAALAAEIAVRERQLMQKVRLGEEHYSLYIHIPFCPSICLYCTFSSSPVSVWEKHAQEYLDTLLAEMRVRHDRIVREGGDKGPQTVYIGGGTPTTLSAQQLDELLTGTEEIWDLSQVKEYTVEAGRPDSFSEDKLKVLKKHGVTRISVNPQTMQDRTLEIIGRRHTAEDTAAAFRMAREAGFDNINMDIILGLPGEGERELAGTLEAIEALRPDSLTVHSLAVKRASRLTRNIREDREKDDGADRGAFRGLSLDNSNDLMHMAQQSAARMGMVPYYLYRQKNMRGNLENTGFAAPGKECLYNILIMEEVQTIQAFGAGASTKTVSADGRIERTISAKDVRVYLERAKQQLWEESSITI